MNILLFGKGGPDYLHDMLYHGLRQLDHNVCEVPVKHSLHADRGDEGLLKFHWEQQRFDGRPDLMLVCALPADYGPGKEEVYKAELKQTLDRFHPKKVVLVDGSDVPVAYPDIPVEAVFKRELLIGEPQPENWYNLPFAAIPEILVAPPAGSKDIDVLFAGSYSGQPFRARVLHELQGFVDRNMLRAVCTLDPVPRATYLDLVRRSKVVVSVRGYGWDCYRYWETPALGALMLTEEIPIHFEDDFVDGVDCFKFRTGDTLDMQKKLVQALSLDDASREKMGIYAWYRTRRCHTPVSRAKFVLSKVFGGI